MLNRHLTAKRALRAVVLALALIFIGLLLRSQWDALRQQPWHLRGDGLALAATLLLLAWTVEVVVWRQALAHCGGRLTLPQALRVWFASILIRYIPGNLWQPLGMTVLAQERGVRPLATLASIALYQAINLLAVLPFAGVYLLFVGSRHLPLPAVGPGWLVLAGLPLCLFLLRPDLLMALLDWGLQRLGRPPLGAALAAGELARLLALAVVDWLLWSGAFAALAAALLVLPTGSATWAALLTAYPLAYAVGYLSVVAPGGLAVREGALALLLAPVLGPGAGALLALAMRTLQIVLEVVVAGGVLLFGREERPVTS